MPYKRRYRRKNKGSKMSLAQAANAAAKALSIALALKKLLNVEKKFSETAGSGSVGTTATVTLLTGLAQGDTQNDRQGNSVKAANLNVNYNAVINGSATATESRVMFVYDRNSDGSAPSINDILDTSGGASSLTAHYNPDFAGSRFIILYDKNINLSINGDRRVSHSFNKKLNHHVKYSGTTAVQADCSSGHLYMIDVSNEVTNTPTINYSCVFRYVDN